MTSVDVIVPCQQNGDYLREYADANNLVRSADYRPSCAFRRLRLTQAAGAN